MADKGRFATKAEIAELKLAFEESDKAITTGSASAGDIIQPEISPRLMNMVVKKYPFYTWMDQMGMITDTGSAKPSYLKKLTGGAGGFIAEDGSISGGADSTYDLLTGTMTSWIFPLEISDMMIEGSKNDVVDIMAQEISDGTEYQMNAINAGMLTGTGSSYSIDGLGHLITTNNENMAGGQITDQFQLDEICNQMMEAGGTPSAIVTSSNVRSQLISTLYPQVAIPLLPKVNLTPGLPFAYQVTSYESPAGDIPIIVDPAMPTTTDQQEIIIPDYSTIELKYLRRLRVVDLAKTKLTESSVLSSFQSFMVRAESFNAKITNIGTKTA